MGLLHQLFTCLIFDVQEKNTTESLIHCHNTSHKTNLKQRTKRKKKLKEKKRLNELGKQKLFQRQASTPGKTVGREFQAKL